jgi:hypothetical protein
MIGQTPHAERNHPEVFHRTTAPNLSAHEKITRIFIVFPPPCALDPRALFGVDEYAGSRPKPAVAGRAACLPHKRPDKRLAAQNDLISALQLDAGAPSHTAVHSLERGPTAYSLPRNLGEPPESI